MLKSLTVSHDPELLRFFFTTTNKWGVNSCSDHGTSTVHPVQFSLPFQSFSSDFHNGIYLCLIDHILLVNKYSLILCLFHLPSNHDNKQQSDTQGNPQTTLYTASQEQSLSIHPSPDKDCNSGSEVALYFCNTSLRESFFHFTPMKVKLHETID